MLLMWVHRQSEDSSCNSVECYWKNQIHSESVVAWNIWQQKTCPRAVLYYQKIPLFWRRRKFEKCELLTSTTHLYSKWNTGWLKAWTNVIPLSTSLMKKVEEETRKQSISSFWFELRYGRIVLSRVSRCKINDDTNRFLTMSSSI